MLSFHQILNLTWEQHEGTQRMTCTAPSPSEMIDSKETVIKKMEVVYTYCSPNLHSPAGKLMCQKDLSDRL